MQTLETILAFALTMFVLSMIASTLVEMIHRAFGLRAKSMHYLLGSVRPMPRIPCVPF